MDAARLLTDGHLVERPRNVLTEIPAQPPITHNSENRPQIERRNGQTPANGHFVDQRIAMTIASLTPSRSPTPSPDELIIQSRGRRTTPDTWSPITLDRLTPRSLTPMTLRSSPRKEVSLVGGTSNIMYSPRRKLNLDEPNADSVIRNSIAKKLSALSASPKRPSSTKMVMEAKRQRLLGGCYDDTIPLDLAVQALTKDQLIDVVRQVAISHPELRGEIEATLPAPDLKPIELQLKNLKRNIFKSIPNTRLTSKRDSLSYHRAAIHINTFKSTCLEFGQQLLRSQQWRSLMDYVLLSWSIVRETPVWDNPPHNKPRTLCFKALSGFTMSAIKNGGFSTAAYKDIRDRLHLYEGDSPDIAPCIRYLESNSHNITL